MKTQLGTFLALVLILLLALPFAFISAASEIFITLVDYATDESYQIRITDESIYINSSILNTELQNSSHFYDCCIYGGVFRFLGYTLINDNSGKQLVIFTYDSNENYQSSYAISAEGSGLPATFAADKYGRAYFTSSENPSLLYCHSKSGMEFNLRLSSPSVELFCLDGENLTIITTDGVYVLKAGIPCLVNAESPYTPCSYKGNNTVVDIKGNEYTYESGKLIKIEPTEPTQAFTAAKDENALQIIERGKYLIIPQGTTVSKLRKALRLKLGELSVTKKSGKVLTSGKLGTGMKIEYKGLVRYAVIIGELTSEGNINSGDLKLMMKLLAGSEEAEEILLLAADTDSNTKLNTKDLLLLKKLY